MSKGSTTTSSSKISKSRSHRRAKRQQRIQGFGAPMETDDDPLKISNPSSSGFSTRRISQYPLPTFATVCARVFAKYFHILSNEDHWEDTREWLKLLPDTIIPKVLSMLRATHPKLLSHAVIATYFLRGNELALTGEMGVTNETLLAIPRIIGQNLRHLHLTDLPKFSDPAYASLIAQLSSLETLNLRGCIKAGPKTADAISRTCTNLKVLNLGFTGISPISLAPILLNCRKLEVLKIAALQNCTDVTFTKLLNALSGDNKDIRKTVFGNLRSLKLRHNPISDISLSSLLHDCPNLARLDLSFTLLRRLPNFHTVPPLEKLSLTSTFITSQELVETVKQLPKLKVLHIGALGARSGTNYNTNISTAMTLNDDALRALTIALENCPEIENVNLVQNARIGTTSKYDSAIGFFIERVGRRCKILNFTGLSGLKSSDLITLMPEHENSLISPLHTLLLNKTSIDDDAAPYISSCANLVNLELAETKITENGAKLIVDTCARLSQLNLTGCRGINVLDRRKFFEVWEADRLQRD